MNYRVYVKKAKDDLLGKVVTGELSLSDGKPVQNPSEGHYITNDFIPVDTHHCYELTSIYIRTNISYYVFPYDANKMYLGRRESRKVRNNEGNLPEQIYIPYSSDVHYIKLQINYSGKDISETKFSMLFLKSSNPVLIHDSNSPEKEYHLISPTLQLGDCSAGSLEFIICPGHSYYENNINLFTDTFYVTRIYKDGSERIIWDGRAITEEIDAEGNKAYHCEGALSYLNDTRITKIKNGTKATIPFFIRNIILNYSVTQSYFMGRIDRSFYSDKENDVYINNPEDIHCDDAIAYLWNPNYESCLQWIGDIQKSFGGHIKILYKPNDTVKNDTICRSFTYIQDFDRFLEIQTLRLPLSSNIRIQKGTLIFYKPANKKLLGIIYKATRNFNFYVGNTINIHVDNGNIIPIDSNLIRRVNNEDQIDNTKNYWIIDNNYAIYKPDALRYPVIHVVLGEDIFEAKITSEISDFATNIIPRGMPTDPVKDEDNYIYLDTTSATIDGKQYSYGVPTDAQGNPYVSDSITDMDLEKQYGRVEGLVEFESANSPQILYNLSIEWFKNIKKKIVKSNIEISLAELGQKIQSNSENPLADPEYIDIWTQVYAEIPAFGITNDSPEKYYVSEMSIPLDDYLNTQITLANKTNLISDSSVNANYMQGTSKNVTGAT